MVEPTDVHYFSEEPPFSLESSALESTEKQSTIVQRLGAEFRFLRNLVAVNLASALEYRVSFISQIVGMFINNGIYFLFWLLFFDRFGNVRGYELQDVFLLFTMVSMGFGLAFMFAGNTGPFLAEIIAQGRLDYYLVFPRNLLTHVIFSRMSISTIGDLSFAAVAYLFTGRFHPMEILLWLVCGVLAALVLAGFSVISGSLAFFIGNARSVSQEATSAIMIFSMYPNTLFSGGARVLLYTLIPAFFVGAMPVEIIKTRSLSMLLMLMLAVVMIWTVAVCIFYWGLRRYESGSAINVNM